MDRRTVGIISTIATILLCGLPGLCLLIFGAVAAAGMPFTTTINGVPTDQTYAPLWLGISLVCTALILIAIPVVVGIFTLRQPKAIAGAQAYSPVTPGAPYTPPPMPYTPPPAPYTPPTTAPGPDNPPPYTPPPTPYVPPSPEAEPPAVADNPPPYTPPSPEAEPPSEPDNPPPAPPSSPDEPLPPAI